MKLKFRHFMPLLVSFTPIDAAPVEVSIGQSGENTAFETEATSAPASNDAATSATFKLISGSADPNSAKLEVLHDGKIPGNDDDPSANFFLTGAESSGRILIDLGETIDVASISTYSWHSSSRAAQKYSVYAAKGSSEEFQAEPGADADPAESGWTLLSKVDTSEKRPGQHAVTLSFEDEKPLGNYRYVLFDISENTSAERFNETFFSEIDIVDAAGPELERAKKPVKITQEFGSQHGDFTYTLDATEAPDLQEWSAKNLVPVMDEWYPKIIEMLPVEGVTPAKRITFTLKKSTELPGRLRGVPAYASGNSVVFNADFMRNEMSGEAIGAGVHEVVHVVQFGGDQGDRRMRRNSRPPSWVTEGVADYIRWFLYEPEAKGAEITKRNFERANYDGSYRITANFFKYVIENYEEDLMRKLNVATHDGYSNDLWKEWTGKTVEELGAEWKEYHKKRLEIEE
jgi:hypothetical protein